MGTTASSHGCDSVVHRMHPLQRQRHPLQPRRCALGRTVMQSLIDGGDRTIELRLLWHLIWLPKIIHRRILLPAPLPALKPLQLKVAFLAVSVDVNRCSPIVSCWRRRPCLHQIILELYIRHFLLYRKALVERLLANGYLRDRCEPALRGGRESAILNVLLNLVLSLFADSCPLRRRLLGGRRRRRKHVGQIS